MARMRLKRRQRVRPTGPLPDRSDLPPAVAEFMRIFDAAGAGFVVGSSGDGLSWTVWDPEGNPVMAFGSGPVVIGGRSLEGLGGACMDVSALWADPEFRRQRDAGLVDVLGRPTHPEGRDFFSEAHHGHEH